MFGISLGARKISMRPSGSETELFHQPLLSGWDFGFFRTPGPGLGNLMFPIARALQGQKFLGGHFITPTFRQMKLGTIIRGEKDYRTYGDDFIGRTLSEWRLKCLSATGTRVDEDGFCSALYGRTTVIYRGLKHYFHDLEGSEDYIGSWFRQRANIRGEVPDSFDVAIHVRFGDFVPSQRRSAGSSVRQPIEWYIDAFKEAQHMMGTSNPRVILFTDARENEVRPLLNYAPVQFDPGQNAITSLFNMSRAQLLIASRSTYSMWASFLGGMITVWPADFDLSPFFPARPGLDHRL